MRFIDTNVLLYSISTNPADSRKRDAARLLLAADDLAISVQVLQEFYVQATRANRADALHHAQAFGRIRTWLRFNVQENTLPLLFQALNIKVTYKLSYWDAAIVAAAHELGCEELLTEDLADGQTLEGVLIKNPFPRP